MDMSLSELWELVADRVSWGTAIHGAAKSQTRLRDWTELNWTDKEQLEFCQTVMYNKMEVAYEWYKENETQ